MRDIRHSHLRKFFDCLMNLLSEELFVPSVKILLFYCLNIRTFANETNRRRNALSVRIQTEQVKKRELITPCNRPCSFNLLRERYWDFLFLFNTLVKIVRLIYCESGIETLSKKIASDYLSCSFNLLRERYWDFCNLIVRTQSLLVRLIYCESGIET